MGDDSSVTRKGAALPHLLKAKQRRRPAPVGQRQHGDTDGPATCPWLRRPWLRRPWLGLRPFPEQPDEPDVPVRRREQPLTVVEKWRTTR